MYRDKSLRDVLSMDLKTAAPGRKKVKIRAAQMYSYGCILKASLDLTCEH